MNLENEESKSFFDPVNGNVAFTSAIDCWGFTLADIAKLAAPNLKIHPKKIQKHLWGDFYLDVNGNFQPALSGQTTLFELLCAKMVIDVYMKNITPEVLKDEKKLNAARTKINQ